MSISGYATPDGTLRFRERFEAMPEANIASGHFRETPQGLHLTSLGMGTYLGQPNESDSQKMTKAAVQSVTSGAVNVLDTAINYRHQLSERALARAIWELDAKHGIQRDELFVCTKNGFLTPDADMHNDSAGFRQWLRDRYLDSGLIEPDDIVGGMHCMAPGYLQEQIDISRQNLGVDTIDLMYLHNAVESQMPVIGRDEFMNRLIEAFEALEAARSAGKIRYYGLATWNCFRVLSGDEDEFFNLETAVRLAETVGGQSHGFRFVQLPFNMAFSEALTLEGQMVDDEPMSLLEAAMALDIGVFTSVPLLQGQLLDQEFPHLQGLGTPAQACLHFARSQPGIIAPLVGHKSVSHVSENLQVASVPPVPLEILENLLSTPKIK